MTQDIVSSTPVDSLNTNHQSWREKRFRELSAPESWFGLVGLHWLEPGNNPVGSASGSVVVLPEGPAHLGDLRWEDGSILWQPAGSPLTTVQEGEESKEGGVILRTDVAGDPSRVRFGNLVFSVIERGGRLAVRVRDLAWREKRSFAGIDCYDFDPAWRIEADWVKLAEPLTLEVQNVTGEMKAITVTARAVFRAAGSEHVLLPMEVQEDGIFFIFRDATSGRETYGGGRFLRARLPESGKLLLDFNRAFNPPCAFTAFATCSLAPPENWLALAVRAGEKKYAGNY